MQVKQYNKKLYSFEKRTGMTGIFSFKEKELLVKYAKDGIITPFIDRLYCLGVLSKNFGLNDIIKVVEEDKDYLRLDALHIDITNTCPLNCPQCYKEDTNSIQMPIQVFRSYIDEAQRLKLFQIAIGGGEPLVHSQIVDFVEYVSKTEMSVTMTTSGYGLTQKLLDKLIKAGLNHMQVSLNSIIKIVNERSRDGFHDAIHAIKILSNTDLSFGINIVIRKDSLSTFLETVEYAKKKGAKNINILRYKPSPTENYRDYVLSSEEFYQLAKWIKQVKGIKIKVDSAYSNLLIYLNNGRVNKERAGCMAGKSFIAISSDGSFKPCSHLKVKEKANSIYEYYTKSKFIQSLKSKTYHIDSLCNTCKYKKVCGGCMAICESLYKDPMRGEMECPTY
ncbi:radical SAM/SPASM domain-containing protein [Oceanirhabdus seepicola]|uniref:Radical SAM protein n=1 Tax=Oceanirhabdus seepicola TaxID=2828781 RepID=A0A9J6P5L2_9CLOT|nr:radical SAM protein [Oceanirhabdus seepicola]MCM1991414.1 radical SAM protein [Oceanirhabdus seepicola]